MVTKQWYCTVTTLSHNLVLAMQQTAARMQAMRRSKAAQYTCTVVCKQAYRKWRAYMETSMDSWVADGRWMRVHNRVYIVNIHKICIHPSASTHE